MITKIGILSKETFDKKIKIKKDSRKQSAIGGVAAYGLTDTLGSKSKDIGIPRKVEYALNDMGVNRILKEYGVAASPNEDAFVRAQNRALDAMKAGAASRPENHFTKNRFFKFLRTHNSRLFPGISTVNTYIATRNDDLNDADGGNRKVTPFLATNAVFALPSMATAVEHANAYSRGLDTININDTAYKGLKKAKPFLYASIAARQLLPHVVANAAGYGVAKLQDKGIDAYNKFQDKHYADTEALLKARKKAKQ